MNTDVELSQTEMVFEVTRADNNTFTLKINGERTTPQHTFVMETGEHLIVRVPIMIELRRE